MTYCMKVLQHTLHSIVCSQKVYVKQNMPLLPVIYSCLLQAGGRPILNQILLELSPPLLPDASSLLGVSLSLCNGFSLLCEGSLDDSVLFWWCINKRN